MYAVPAASTATPGCSPGPTEIAPAADGAKTKALTVAMTAAAALRIPKLVTTFARG
jgi:hypothetical protein